MMYIIDDYLTIPELKTLINSKNFYIDINNTEIYHTIETEKNNYIDFNKLMTYWFYNKNFDIENLFNLICTEFFDYKIRTYDYFIDISKSSLDLYNIVNNNLLKEEVIASSILFLKNIFKSTNIANSFRQINSKYVSNDIANKDDIYSDIMKNLNKIKSNNSFFLNISKIFNISQNNNNNYNIDTEYDCLLYGIVKNFNIAPMSNKTEKEKFSYTKNTKFLKNTEHLYKYNDTKLQLEESYIFQKIFSLKSRLYHFNENITENKHIFKALLPVIECDKKSKEKMNVLNLYCNKQILVILFYLNMFL